MAYDDMWRLKEPVGSGSPLLGLKYSLIDDIIKPASNCTKMVHTHRNVLIICFRNNFTLEIICENKFCSLVQLWKFFNNENFLIYGSSFSAAVCVGGAFGKFQY